MNEVIICKSCYSNDVIIGLDNRYYCNDCSNIYIDDGSTAEIVLFGRHGKKELPECFTNYNSYDRICSDICNCKKKCLQISPPIDYFKSDKSDLSDEKEQVCPNCGVVDKGRFCSNCGNELNLEKKETHIVFEMIKSIFSDWPLYFKTVYLTIFNSNYFFSGAFSRHSSLFFKNTGTLEPVKFFFINSTFVAITAFLCNYLFFDKVEGGNFFSDLLELFYILIWMYIPGLILGFFVQIGLRQLTAIRKKEITSVGKVSLNNVMKANLYTSTIDILATPLILSISHEDFEKFGLLIIGFILAFIGRIISQLILLPYALKYSCGIPKTVAQYGVNALFAIPIIITNLIRLFSI